MAPFIRSLASLASLALWFGPARFRADYGSAVVADFTALLQAEQRRRGPAAMLVLWMRGLGDAVKTARREQQLSGPPRAGRPFGDLSGDLQSALRAARRSPGFSLTIVLTLVFGLGLASAIFAFGDGYLFRPVPFDQPGQLYLVRAPDARGEFLESTEAEALKASHLAELGFVDGVRSAPVSFASMEIGGRTVRLHVSGVGPDFGQVLGVPLVGGRHFTADDHRGAGSIPIWLSHRFWQAEFGGDRAVIGRRFLVREGDRQVEVEVVGITDARITTFNTRFGRSNVLPDAFGPAPDRPPASNTLATPIVRLSGGWTVDRATAAIAAALQSIAPGKDGRSRMVRLDPLAGEFGRTGRSTAMLFIIGAALALLLVTINLVHLLLTRGAARAAEVATRAAIGASRWRIARLFLVESLAHGVVGIAGGLLLGAWLTAVLAARIPTRGSDLGTLALVVMRFDLRVIAVAIVMGLVVAFLGGIWPAWRAVRRPLAVVTRSAAGVGARVSPRVSRLILTSEVAISTVVLMGTIFAGIGLWRFVYQPLGFDLDGRFNVGFPALPGQSPTATKTTNWLALDEALRRIDGVKALAASIDQPRETVRVGERVFEAREVLVGAFGAQYFAAHGNHLVQGRFPDDGEIATRIPLAVVDERFASAAWPSAAAVGSRLQVGDTSYDVVGVVENPRYSLIREVPPVLFVPAAPVNERHSVTVFAPELSATELTQRFTSVMSSAAPGFSPNVSPQTFERMFDDELANARFQQPIIIVLGVFAFTVAGVGLFGLVAYLVEQRTRDFGIRLALGARARDIRRHLAAESLWPASVGLAIGLAAAWGLQGVMRATMFGWESSGPLAAAAVGGVVLAVAMIAIAGPARRVLRIDPAITLRTE